MQFFQDPKTRRTWRRITLAMSTSVLFAASFCVQAQAYPAKPIRLIVGFTAGGATDVMARTTAQFLGEALGASVVVENRTGAGGAIAVSSVVSAPADGYTLVFSSTGPLIITPRGAPLKELAPVGLVGRMTFGLVVPASHPAKDLQEFLALARLAARPMTYASTGYGSMTHIGMEMLKHGAGLNFIHIPYRGQAAATPDLIAGRIDMFFDGLAPSMPNVKSGRLKYLAIASSERSAAAPSVPTVAEQGFPGFDASPWYGIWAPGGTPPEIVARLSDALLEVTRSKALRDRFTELGLDAMTGDSEKLAQFTESERVRIGRIIKEANIRLE